MSFGFSYNFSAKPKTGLQGLTEVARATMQGDLSNGDEFCS